MQNTEQPPLPDRLPPQAAETAPQPGSPPAPEPESAQADKLPILNRLRPSIWD